MFVLYYYIINATILKFNSVSMKWYSKPEKLEWFYSTLIEFRPNDSETYGTYQILPVLSQGLFSKKWNGEISLPLDQALVRVFIDNKAIFQKKCMTKYGNAELKRKEPAE